MRDPAVLSPPSASSNVHPLRWSFIAFILIFIAQVARLWERFSYMQSGAQTVGQIAGAALGAFLFAVLFALLVALVVAGMMAAFKRPFRASLWRGYSVGVAAIACVFLLGCLCSQFMTFLDKRDARKKSVHEVASGLESDLRTLSKVMEEDGKLNEDGTIHHTDFRFKSDAPASNDMERVRNLIHLFFNDMLQIQNDYVAALGKAGIERLLKPDRLDQDAGFKESRQMLVDLRKTAETFRGKTSDAMEKFPDRLNDPALSSEINQGLLRGYQKGLATTMPRFKENWDLELSVIDRYTEMIDFLEATRDHWEARDGKFIFERNEDLKRFNDKLAEVTAIARRQDEIRQESLQSASEKFGALKAGSSK